MPDDIKAASSYLNRPLRPYEAVKAKIMEQMYPIDEVMSGAFERRFDASGSPILVDRDGNGPDGKPVDLPTPPPVPGAARSAYHLGYLKALAGVSEWIAAAALNPAMHPRTLEVLNAEITRLWRDGGRS